MVRSLLDKPAPSDTVVEAGRDRLRDAARTGPHARGTHRTMWLTAGLGLTAATAAAAVAVAATAGGDGGGGGVRPGGGARSGTPTIALDARTVLLAAATEADGQAVKAGAYWHSLTLSRNYYQVDSPEGAY